MRYPWNLNYWKSGEWQVVNERLHDLEKKNVAYNPPRSCLFDNLRRLTPERVSVCIVGQDPYPDQRFATGEAFSIPRGVSSLDFPSTLRTLFKEYCKDLHAPYPSSGDLTKWVDQGVLLINAIPTCTVGKSLSHDWREYSYLTSEILRRVAEYGAVFVFVGSVAQRYVSDIPQDGKSEVICVGPPSPRGALRAKVPFIGSRLFSTINDRLNAIDLDPIDWRLDVPTQSSVSEDSVPRSGVVLDNINAIDLGGQTWPVCDSALSKGEQ